MQNRIIRKKELCEITGLSYSTIYRLEKLGRFPKRRKLGDWAVGWLGKDVDTWVASQATIV